MVVQVAHIKGQYADAIVAATTFYEGMGWGEVAEAVKKGFAESGYVAALRRAADVELAKHGNEGGVAFDAANNYAMAGDRARALDSLKRPTRIAIPICRISGATASSIPGTPSRASGAAAEDGTCPSRTPQLSGYRIRPTR